MSKPLVSVVTITYNQQHLLKNAIESVLSQQGNLIKEYIIADDFSTDGTIKIIEEYYHKNPKLIKPVFRNNNLGALANFYDALLKCEGKYIAFLAGDDYWIDPLKIKKQVSFLEMNPDCTIYGTNVVKKYLITNKDCLTNQVSGIIELKPPDFFLGGALNLIGALIRREQVDQLPDIYYGEDTQLSMFLAHKGKCIIDTNSVSAVYRISENGLAHRLKSNKEKINDLICKMKKNIEWNEYFNNEYSAELETANTKIIKKIIMRALKSLDFRTALIFLYSLNPNSFESSYLKRLVNIFRYPLNFFDQKLTRKYIERLKLAVEEKY
ncbi:MAG: glycosyltransferase family 2 protein [Bacteroidetes bacterium]|nr:glycosyltransferase family 2 protein [Bacteroidota bacterium]MBL6964378.1 glycosyltransferase family 2 protein [Bacteroidota bacterium]